MTLEDLSDEDLLTGLLIKEIRLKDDELRKERQAKNEILARYERTLTSNRELETKAALLEAEVKRQGVALEGLQTIAKEHARACPKCFRKMIETICFRGTGNWFWCRNCDRPPTREQLGCDGPLGSHESSFLGIP